MTLRNPTRLELPILRQVSEFPGGVAIHSTQRYVKNLFKNAFNMYANMVEHMTPLCVTTLVSEGQGTINRMDV